MSSCRQAPNSLMRPNQAVEIFNLLYQHSSSFASCLSIRNHFDEILSFILILRPSITTTCWLLCKSCNSICPLEFLPVLPYLEVPMVCCICWTGITGYLYLWVYSLLLGMEIHFVDLKSNRIEGFHVMSLQQNLPSHAAHSGHVGSHKIWPNSLLIKLHKA